MHYTYVCMYALILYVLRTIITRIKNTITVVLNSLYMLQTHCICDELKSLVAEKGQLHLPPLKYCLPCMLQAAFCIAVPASSNAKCRLPCLRAAQQC